MCRNPILYWIIEQTDSVQGKQYWYKVSGKDQDFNLWCFNTGPFPTELVPVIFISFLTEIDLTNFLLQIRFVKSGPAMTLKISSRNASLTDISIDMVPVFSLPSCQWPFINRKSKRILKDAYEVKFMFIVGWM